MRYLYVGEKWMKIYLSRVVLGVIAVIVNITLLTVYVTHLPLGLVPKNSDVISALIPLDIIFVVCIIVAGKGYEEQTAE